LIPTSVASNDLQRFISRLPVDNTLAVLPSFHSTTVSDMEVILRTGTIEAKRCKVFEEDLAYFFYGKPSYEVSHGVNKSFRNNFYMPGCFVVDTNKLPIHRIFPFDSGAFMTERYKDNFPKNPNISNYEIQTDIASILKYIHAFFQNNVNYLKGKSLINDSNLVNITTQSIASLLESPGYENFDERAVTLEIQCKENVILSEALMAVIIPDEFEENEYFIDFINRNVSVQVLSYPVHYPVAPTRYNESIYIRSMDFYEEIGGFSHV
jgi:hypothetical protein